MRQPVEPPRTPWVFPDPGSADADGIVGLGADLEPGTLLAAYRNGIFPMSLAPDGPIAWWSPDPRAILPVDGLRITRSLRQSMRSYRTTIDMACAEVIAACADPRRPGGWISPEFRDAYLRLHALGWVHSVETWEGDRLVGGLYGVSIGALFAGESMFHRRRDASKVALARLVEVMATVTDPVLDVQWLTPHLASLGAVEVPRPVYLERVAGAVTAIPPVLA